MKKVFIAFMTFILLWGMVSWVDVISDNSSPNPEHSNYNLFVVMEKTRG